ncbi:PLP-dependent aminotransferase family protein [Bacillus salitolerans]|uniref:PLP-dependent aminotransferase family protein n=1 Tax=Bacillus salitolerans TaxID=1437434 RepID=A0ABW4LZ00_9BACI
MGKLYKDKAHLFHEVYDYVVNRIGSKEWKEHDKLPSVRQLAEELQVNRLTVLKAYQLLKKHNKVYVKDKVGYYVQTPLPSLVDLDNLNNPIVTAYVQKNALSEIHQAKVKYNFSQALIDPSLLPNQYFSNYVKQVFDDYPKLLSTYSSVKGDEELRESLAAYFEKEYKTYVHGDNVMILSGSQQGIQLVAQTFIKPRDTVIIERPCFSAAIDIFESKGAKIVPIDITPTGYDLECLEHIMKQHKPRLFYLTPTFNNPTGYTVPTFQRKELVALAEKYRCLLVEDDAYHDIYFSEKPPTPVFTYDTVGTVIYLRSFSKYISPGLRMSIIICHHSIMEPLVSARFLMDNGSPLLNQKIFLRYFHSDRLQQHLDKLRIALQIRKEWMEGELANTTWQWHSPNGGLNLWVKLSDEISTDSLLSKALAHYISFVPGQVFDPSKQYKSWIRLSYSFSNEKLIKEGMEKIIQLNQE